MAAKKSYLVLVGAIMLAAIVVTATMMGSHLFKSSRSGPNQSAESGESSPAAGGAGAGENDSHDGQSGRASGPEADGTVTSPQGPARQVVDIDENSAEIKAALPAFHRTDDSYFRGAVPARGGIELLQRLGVKTIIDLRSYYDHADDVGVEAESLGITYYWLPLSVWDPASDAQTAEFLSVAGNRSREPVFVFCTDGLNRTGEMTAIYRIIQDGWSVENAIKEMDDLGFGTHYYSLRSYVWHYARHHGPGAKPQKPSWKIGR
jgi:hypothetical protein